MTRRKESPAYHEAAKARRALQKRTAIMEFTGPHASPYTRRFYKAIGQDGSVWIYMLPGDGDKRGRVVKC